MAVPNESIHYISWTGFVDNNNLIVRYETKTETYYTKVSGEWLLSTTGLDRL